MIEHQTEYQTKTVFRLTSFIFLICDAITNFADDHFQSQLIVLSKLHFTVYFVSSRSKPIIGLIELVSIFSSFQIRKFLIIGFDQEDMK